MSVDARLRQPAGKPAGLRLGQVIGKAAIWVLMVLGVLVCVAPFLIGIYIAILPYQIDIVPYRWHIDEWTFDGFKNAWTHIDMRRFGQTSLIYSTVNAALTTLLATVAGYVFARLEFPFKKAMWALLLAGMMVPGMVTLVPRFTMMVRWPLAGGNDIVGRGGSGFYDTWWGLLLPGLMSASSSFMMRQFFQTLPGQLEDAARVDGASEWLIFFGIMVPMAVPGVVTTFMFQFQGAWNELAWPMMITTSLPMRTLAVGMVVLAENLQGWGEGQTGGAPPLNWGQASAIIAAVPLIVIFTAGQRWFVRGIALTGIK